MKLSHTKTYFLGGFLFGLVFPLFSWLLDGLVFHHFSFGWDMVVQIHKSNPLHYVIDSAPLVLSVAFGMTGINLDSREKEAERHNTRTYTKEYNKQNHSLVKSMQLVTLLAPILVSVVMVGSFFVLHNFLSKKDDDALVINISGRQRMLSQRIAKHAVYLTQTKGEEQVHHINGLTESLLVFKTAHQNLTKKENTLGFSENYVLSENIKNLYDSLQPYYEGLVKNAEDLIEFNDLSNSEQKSEEFIKYFERIERNERAFLPIMNSIVFAYAEEGEEKVATLRIVQGSVVILIILTVISVAFFWLRPLTTRLKTAFHRIEEATDELQTQNEELQASEEELRQNAEEMQSINDRLVIAQEQMHVKQQLLTKAEEIVEIGSFNFDIETRNYTYSENLALVYGLDEDEMASPAKQLKYFHPEDAKEIRDQLIALTKGLQEQVSTTARFKNSSEQEWRFFKCYSSLVRDAEGKPLTVIGVIQDITETEKNKQALEEAQKQLQSLTDNLEGIMFRSQINPDWTMEFISSGVEKMTGYPAKEFLKDGSISFSDIIHKEDNFVDEQIDVAIKNKSSYQVEYRIIDKNQREIWVEELGTPVYDFNGNPIFIDGVILDISERRYAQKLLKEKNDKVNDLLEKVSKNKDTLEEAQRLAKVVSYEMNIYTKEVTWSDSFASVFGVEKEQVPNNTEVFETWIEPTQLEKINENWARAITEKTEFDDVYKIHVSLNDRIFYIRERGYPIFDEAGRMIGMKGTLQDITPSETVKQELEKKSNVIAKQNQNFVASVNYAQRIQSALLGGTQDIKHVFKDGFIFFEPKDIVSGDFYWYAQLDQQRKVAIVADCTGHGVPGAFMSLLGITTLNEIILQRNITTPSEILNQLHQAIQNTLKQQSTQNRDGMDITVAVIDEGVGTLEFAGAKNPLVCVNKRRKRGGAEANLTVIKGDSFSVGGRSPKTQDALYTNHVIDLDNIEAFYLYSDGFQDQFGGEENMKFMSVKFRELLYNTHSTSMRHQRVSLKRALMNWMGTENEQIDDICVMGITV